MPLSETPRQSADLSFKVIHPLHEHAQIALPFAHALKLALASRGELEIVDLRSNHEGGAGVRALLEKWGVLPPNSPREDVEKIGLKVTKVIKNGNEKKDLTKRIEKHFHDVLVIGVDSHKDILHLFGQDLVAYLATNIRTAALYVPSAGRPFVDPFTGEALLNTVLMPIAASPPPDGAFKLLRRLLGIFPAVRPRIIGLHSGVEFPFVSGSLLEGLSWTEQLASEGVVKAVVDAARAHRADLIIMATKGRDTLAKKIMGSITEQVLRASPCPVLSVPAEE